MRRIIGVARRVCGGRRAATASAQSTPPTKEPGKLIIGFDLPAPSFWNGRATGTTIKNPTGFEYAMSQAIAKRLGLKLELLRSPFGGLFSPAPKKFDVAFEEVTITTQRAKVVGFTTPYFAANQGVLIARGSRRRSASRTSSPCKRARRRTRPGSRGSRASSDPQRSRSCTPPRRRQRSTPWRQGAAKR